MSLDYKNTIMWDEIFQQPQAIKHAIERNADQIAEIAKAVKARKIKHLVLIARGSSEHACFVAKYVAEINTELYVSMVQPSIFTAYHGKVDYGDALCVALSQSGGARDVAKVLLACKEKGALTATLTNVRGSVLGDLGDYNLNNECGPELCVTATKSFMTQVIFLIALINAIAPSDKLTAFLSQADQAATHALSLSDQIEKHLALFEKEDHMMIFARGISFAMGLEAELKIQETCTLDARCYAVSDYLHGPIVTANPNIPALFYVFDEHTDQDTIQLLNKLKHEKNVDVLVITNHSDLAEQSNSILIDTKQEELNGVIIGMMLSQMLACQLSVKRGYNPDAPIGVTKNTVTF